MGFGRAGPPADTAGATAWVCPKLDAQIGDAEHRVLVSRLSLSQIRSQRITPARHPAG